MVDRGANGGLVGSDMCVIHKTHRKINIQGIDNHEVTGLDVVTAATLLNTSQGKVIGIFNEYAYLGKGSSIHSSGQLEWFKTNVDEKSVKVGGTQLITTLDGYSVPLLIKDGLAYATSLGKPTDQDMDAYPHVFLTSPDEWDPSVLDHDPPHLDVLDPSQVPDQPFGDPMFDAYGDFKEYIIANLNILLDAPPEACGSYTDISSVFTANLHQSSPQEPDWNALHPFLHGHPHPASRTLSMSPPGMGLLHTPRITSKSTLSLAILFSTSPDAVKLLQQTPSSLTLLLLMMVPPWPNSSVALILLSVMPTLDGYSVPLLIKDGLAYATSLGKPTDQDMDAYPHVFLTSPDEWDPSVLDHDPPHLDVLDPSQVPDQPFGDPMFDAYGDFKEYIIANLNILLDAPPEACGSYTDISSVFTANLHQSSPQEPDWNALHPFLHGHPHPASRTLSMSPPGMGLLHTPRITSKSTLSLAILFSTSPDAVKLLQQTPSSLTLLLLMMVPPWPNSSVALILLSVMPMASNHPNNSSTPSLITSENGEPWIPSSVMEANMKSPNESLISSLPSSSKIISLNLITNTKIRLKIILDLPSVTPTLS